VIAVSLAADAGAGHLIVRDPQEERGRLDIRRVEMVGETNARWNIVTYPGWSIRDIWDRGYFLVFLDTFGSDRHDYYAIVRAKRAKLKAVLMRDRAEKRDYRVAELGISKIDRRSIRVFVPHRHMRFSSAQLTYNWYVQTIFSAKGKCRRVCFDLAPDAGGVEEPVPQG
jgi:hypothetical protein